MSEFLLHTTILKIKNELECDLSEIGVLCAIPKTSICHCICFCIWCKPPSWQYSAITLLFFDSWVVSQNACLRWHLVGVTGVTSGSHWSVQCSALMPLPCQLNTWTPEQGYSHITNRLRWKRSIQLKTVSFLSVILYHWGTLMKPLDTIRLDTHKK